VSFEEEKERLQWEGFAEKGFKSEETTMFYYINVTTF